MKRAFAIVFLVFVNIIVFGQTIDFEFVNYDDPTYLTNNTRLQHGLSWDNIRWGLTTGYYKNWHPVTWWSYFLDYELYGLDAGRFHMTNVVIHILATLFLFFALFEMTKGYWESLIVAVLFAIHPQHVQSVAWVSERKDVLSAMFMGLLFLSYYRYIQKGYGLKWYLITLFIFALGLMSKSMLVTMPFVLLLFDYWPLKLLTNKKAVRRALLDKLPMIYMAIGASIITFVAQSTGGATMSMETYGLPGRMANALNSYVVYLFRTVWPVNLSFYYPLDTHVVPIGTGIASSILLLSISMMLWKGRRIAPQALMGWLFYLVTLLPVIGLLQVGTQANADRYTYIPLIGIFIAVVYTLHPWLCSTENRKRVSRIGYISLLAVGLVLSFKETMFWHDSGLLAGRTLMVDRNNSMANLMAAVVHWEHESYDQADAFFRKASERDPDILSINIQRSMFLAERGRLDEAKELLLSYHERHPEEGMTMHFLGHVSRAEGEVEESIEWYKIAIDTNPRVSMYHVGYANLLAQIGELQASLKEYDIALKYNPENVLAHHNRASALFYHHRTREALPYVQEALRLDPELSESLDLIEAIKAELDTQ